VIYLYTGDISIDNNQNTVKDVDMEKISKFGDEEGVDCLIMEDTYDGKKHEDREEMIQQLLKTLKEKLENGGRCLIAAYALGRTQELVSILWNNRDKLGDTKIFVGGTAKFAYDVYRKHKVELPSYSIVNIKMKGEKEEINPKFYYLGNDTLGRKKFSFEKIKKAIFISSDGRISSNLKSQSWILLQNLDPDKDFVISTGYLGDIKEITEDPLNLTEKEIKNFLKNKKTKTKIEEFFYHYPLSAHADMSGLKKLVEKIKPKKVILIHRGHKNEQDLKLPEVISKLGLGIETVVPKDREIVQLI